MLETLRHRAARIDIELVVQGGDGTLPKEGDIYLPPSHQFVALLVRVKNLAGEQASTMGLNPLTSFDRRTNPFRDGLRAGAEKLRGL
jgi:hypothetical protein